MATADDLLAICRRLVDEIEHREAADGAAVVRLQALVLELAHLATTPLVAGAESSSRFLGPLAPPRKRAELAPRFLDLGFYVSALDPLGDMAKRKTGVGDAMDDLMDLYGELHRTLRLASEEGLEAAAQHLRGRFASFWGEDALALAAYLHGSRAARGV